MYETVALMHNVISWHHSCLKVQTAASDLQILSASCYRTASQGINLISPPSRGLLEASANTIQGHCAVHCCPWDATQTSDGIDSVQVAYLRIL